MKTLLTTLVILGLGGYFGASCFVAVDETEYVIIKRFGRPARILLEPGLRLKYPVPAETVVRFDNRLQILVDPPEGMPVKEYLTKDKKNVELTTSTCWRIERSEEAVLRFMETVRDRRGAEIRLADVVKSNFNARLGSADFEVLVSTDESKRRWKEVVAEIQRTCAAVAKASFGIEIVDLRIQRLSFPAQNRRSVFERMRAERQRIATRYRSEGDEQAMMIRAEAQAQQERILAEAREQSARIRGEADAEATRIYGDAYSADPEFYRFLRTLESYETGLDADTVLILPADAEFFHLLTRPDLPLKQTPEPTVMETLTRDGDNEPEPAPSPES